MITPNQTPATPQLADLNRLLKQEILLQINCIQVGTIQKFDSATQKAQVSINFKKVLFPSETGAPTFEEYPVLVDVPCVTLFGGLASLQMPITPGDTCLLFFNDRNIDNWVATGQVAAPASARLHSMADAFALVGVKSMANPITPFDSTRMSMNYGTTVVAVGPALVKIANATTTLNTLLQTLIVQLQTLVTATAAITVTGVSTGGQSSGPPGNAAAIAAVGVSLGVTAGQIAALLE